MGSHSINTEEGETEERKRITPQTRRKERGRQAWGEGRREVQVSGLGFASLGTRWSTRMRRKWGQCPRVDGQSADSLWQPECCLEVLAFKTDVLNARASRLLTGRR